jgi:ProP effector
MLTLRPAAAQQVRRRLGLDTPTKGSRGLSAEEARRVRGRRIKAFRELLAERYPVAFPPISMPLSSALKIGLDRDLRARHPDIPLKTLKLVLRRHVSQACYRELLIAGAPRVDLDGNRAGVVTVEEAEHAAERLQQLALSSHDRGNGAT